MVPLPPLFGEPLRRRLEQTRPELAKELHRRAAGRYEGAALLDDAIDHGRLQECVAAGHLLLDNLRGAAVFPHSLVSHVVGLAYLESGDLAAAGEIVVQGVRMGREAGCPMGTVLALCSLAHLSTLQGRLHEARARYEQALEWAVDDRSRPSPVAGLAHIGLGRLLVEWDELQRAARHLEEGIALAGSWSELATLPGHAGLGTICAIQGDYDGALQHLEKAEQIAIGSDLAGHEQEVVRLLKARIWLAQGNIEATAGWAEERNLAATPGEAEADLRDTGRGFVACRLRTQEYLLLARLFHITRQETKACDLLERLIELGEASGDSWLA